MLISSKVDAQALFVNLQAVIVDEIHAFAGDDRGGHLLAVLSRIERLCGRELQRIGLSATVGNPEDLLHWLAGSCVGPRQVCYPSDTAVVSADVKLDYVGSLPKAAIVISRLHRGEKPLVFVDRRSRAEQLAGELRSLEVATFVTHSSLRQDERRLAVDWGRRLANVEAAEGTGKSRWRGAGPTLAFSLCQAMRRILASDARAPQLSQRAQHRLDEIRQEHPWIHADGLTLRFCPSGKTAWWTFAGTRANATLAGALLRRCGGRVENDALCVTLAGVEEQPLIEQVVRQLLEVDPSTMEPHVEEAAIDGLKFSQCLPKELALATFAARLRDEPATRAILSQPMRIVSGV